MTSHSTLDPESFQRLLSNAFAVQESGMDAESLTAIVELQRAIATGEADVDRVMDLIAVRARSVANAAGIMVGLLNGNQLIYRAGSGNGATYVGQHVTAILSGHNAGSGEILRVENAQTDRRIEAAICRQFGAHSLLMLPFYRDGTMVGVLDVLFDEAHAFQHREVLTYRLMAALVGDAMSYAAMPEQKKAPAADLSSTRRSSGPAGPHREEEVLNDRISVPEFTRSAWATINRAKRIPLNVGRWETAVAAVAVLVIACWIGFSDRRPPSPLGISGLQGSNTLEHQTPVAPAKRDVANRASRPQTTLGREPRESKTFRDMPPRMLEKTIRVRYFSDDVTVRYFTPQPPPPRALDRDRGVRYISEDVTVRYFPPKPAVALPSTPNGSPAQSASR